MTINMQYDGIISSEEARGRGGSTVLFERCGQREQANFISAQSVAWPRRFKPPYRLNIIGLGDVGRTLAVGLKMLGGGVLKEIGIYDIDAARAAATEMELNQIMAPAFVAVPVEIKDEDTLFDCDVLVFTASRAVPELGATVADVRLAQFKHNAAILSDYVARAIAHQYAGLFAIMSDPVDLLCRVAFDQACSLNGPQLMPIQIRGFGLGVMYARASYYAKRNGWHYFGKRGTVYGPHGAGLVAVDDGANFDLVRSQRLAEKAIAANLAVRANGQKPYIGPALSSGALSLIALLEGHWHYSAVAFDSIFWGLKNRLTANGIEIAKLPYQPQLANWLDAAMIQLREQYDALSNQR